MARVAEKTERKLLIVGIVVAIITAFFLSPRETFSQASAPITGYAWSDTIGWISFNCSDLGTCGSANYGLAIAADGTISGYAWSEHIGWISANSADLAGCPSAPCTARMDDLSIEGWLRALAGGTSQSGGWDGFISLSGANYGPTLSSNGFFSGYAWGDMNVGWVSFSGAGQSVWTTWVPQCATTYVCTDATHRQNACQSAVPEACASGLICSAGACTLPPEPNTSPGNDLTVTPRFVRAGGSAAVSWLVNDATSCTVTENSPDIDDSWSSISSATASCTHAGNACMSGPIRGTVTYTLSCTGPGGTLVQTATVYSNPSWREI